MDWLGYESSAPEIEDIVLRKSESAEIENLIATALTPRQIELARLLLEGYNYTDAAREMGVSPQRTSRLAAQMRRKLKDKLASKCQNDPSLLEALNRE